MLVFRDETLTVLVGPPLAFVDYIKIKVLFKNHAKMESSMRLSPRRIKSTPTIILYELRMIGLKTRPSSLLRKLEAIIKKWRGLVRWYMQGHTSMRGEVVVHIVGERFGRVNRVDNLVASWRRAIARILLNKKDHQQGGHKGVQQGGVQYGGMHHKVTQHEGVQQEVAQRGGVQQEVAQQEAQHPGNLQGGQVGASTNSKRHDLSKLKKATWIAVGSTNIYMDVQVMHENFDVAKAKMWAEVASSVDATMCSHTEPALPVDIGHSLAAPQVPPRSKHEPRESPSRPRAELHAGQQHAQQAQHAQHDPKSLLPQQKRSAQHHALPIPSQTSRVIQLS